MMLEQSVADLEKSVAKTIDTLDRGMKHIQMLTDALRDIKSIAEDRYNGPEDRTFGLILSICRGAGV